MAAQNQDAKRYTEIRNSKALRDYTIGERFEAEVGEHVSQPEGDAGAVEHVGGRAGIEVEGHHRRALAVLAAMELGV